MSSQNCIFLLLLSWLTTILAFQPITPSAVSSNHLPFVHTRQNAVPVLDEWKVLPNGRVEGKVSNHPEIEDGAVISTSPVAINPDDVTLNRTIYVATKSGTQYMLRKPSPGGAISSGLNVDYSSDFVNAVDNPTQGISETKKLLQQVKDAGIAGVISYALWEFGFWAISVPVCIGAYREVTGHWPDFSNQEDLKQLGAEAFAFVNVARFAVPLRIGLALGTTPWIQKNIVDRFLSKDTNATRSS